MNWCSRKAVQYALAVILVAPSMGLMASAQSLSVLPVNILLGPGEKASTLTVTNKGTSKTSIQIRAFGWNQDGDNDVLSPSDLIVVSPPITSIAPGASQVVRLILREQPQVREMTYRIILDQIPPPAEPGVVHVVLRLSIPIFAQPFGRVAPLLRFHGEVKGGQLYLVGSNDGLRHEAIRDVELSTTDGRKLTVASGSSPYILAGMTRHWAIDTQGPLPLLNDILQLKAKSDAGAIEQKVPVVAGP